MPHDAAMDGEALRLAHEHALRHLASLNDRPVGPCPAPEVIRAALGDMPEQGDKPAAVIDHLVLACEPGLVASNGPRYFGFVFGGAVPGALAADWLVSAWDQNACFYVASPAAAAVEQAAAEWLLDLFDLPRESACGFVTGCQAANFMGLLAARRSVLQRAGWDVHADGLRGAPPVRVIASEQAHSTIDRAASILGLGAARIERVRADEQGRMSPDDLARVLGAGDGPAIVCAQAGNVNTGAFDRMPPIADACQAHGAWLHVDGAFGLWGRVSPSIAPHLEGVERADSWATDAHKWLNVPYDCGVVIVRDGAALHAATRYEGDYLIKGGGRRDGCDFAVESSRRARGVPVYAALRSLGRAGVRRLIERNCAQARRMAERLAAGGAQILNDVVLNQVLVDLHAPKGRAHDAHIDAVIERIQQDGVCWLGGTRWNGQRALRISVSCWLTKDEDIDRSAAAILDAAASESQPGGL